MDFEYQVVHLLYSTYATTSLPRMQTRWGMGKQSNNCGSIYRNTYATASLPRMQTKGGG